MREISLSYLALWKVTDMSRAKRRQRQFDQSQPFDSNTSRYSDKNAARLSTGRDGFGHIASANRRSSFKALNENQARLLASIDAYDCTFALGPPGTGKTRCAVEKAVAFLHESVHNIAICTNPQFEIGEKLGTLPGDMEEKIAISSRPIRNEFNKSLSPSHVDNLVRSKRLRFEPLGSILGLTFDNSFIIFDEAQTSKPMQAKALLTRFGQNSKLVVCGDFKDQNYLNELSGLEDAYNRLGHLPGIGSVEFTPDDIVRSGLVKQVILAYRGS